MNNIISEIKNTLEGITIRLHEAEDWISDLEDKVKRNSQVEHLQEKRLKKKYEDSLRELQDNIKHNNIWIIGMPEGEEKEQGIETLFEKMIENCQNWRGEKPCKFKKHRGSQSRWTQTGLSKTHHN